jgi:hypothetical protein
MGQYQYLGIILLILGMVAFAVLPDLVLGSVVYGVLFVAGMVVYGIDHDGPSL